MPPTTAVRPPEAFDVLLMLKHLTSIVLAPSPPWFIPARTVPVAAVLLPSTSRLKSLGRLKTTAEIDVEVPAAVDRLRRRCAGSRQHVRPAPIAPAAASATRNF